LIGRYTVEFEDGGTLTGAVDASWKASRDGPEGWTASGFDDAAWPAVRVLGAYGSEPWGAFVEQPRHAGPLTASPVKSDPFVGRCEIPRDLDLRRSRVYLEMDELTPEAAARVTVNGVYAGGFIGKPFRLEVTNHLKPGTNNVIIEPFAPKGIRLQVYPR
jgi:hypothetical protein